VIPLRIRKLKEIIMVAEPPPHLWWT